MHIVFLGNCQVEALAQIITRFVAPYEDLTTDFIDAYDVISQSSYERLGSARIVVAQATAQPPNLAHDHIPAAARLFLVPMVSGGFLYPYRGAFHPAAPQCRSGNHPYHPEYSDSYLVRLYRAGVTAEDALRRYRAFDVAHAAHVERRYELALESQRLLDARSGFACADIIERHLGEEPLFESAFHFGARIGRHLAAGLCDRLGLDAKYGQRIRDHLNGVPFVPRHVPPHPSVARHFGLRWATEDRRYKFLWEGGYSFDEYVVRFMQARWSRSLQEGILDARSGHPGARAKLEVGLAEAPRSAVGLHELSVIAEREGDQGAAMALQLRAALLSGKFAIHLRLGHLSLRAGDLAGAERAFRTATDADAVNGAAWSALADVQTRLGWLDAAQSSARKAQLYATDPAIAASALAGLQAHLAARDSGLTHALAHEAAAPPHRGDRPMMLFPLVAPADDLDWPPGQERSWHDAEGEGTTGFRWTSEAEIPWILQDDPIGPAIVSIFIPVRMEVHQGFATSCVVKIGDQSARLSPVPGGFGARLDLGAPMAALACLVTPPPVRAADVTGTADSRRLGLAIAMDPAQPEAPPIAAREGTVRRIVRRLRPPVEALDRSS